MWNETVAENNIYIFFILLRFDFHISCLSVFFFLCDLHELLTCVLCLWHQGDFGPQIPDIMILKHRNHYTWYDCFRWRHLYIWCDDLGAHTSVLHTSWGTYISTSHMMMILRHICQNFTHHDNLEPHTSVLHTSWWFWGT